MSSEGHLPGFDGATVSPIRLRSPRRTSWGRSFSSISGLPPARTGSARLDLTCVWAEKYDDRGLVTVGVHTPEFPFEQDVDNVRQAVKDMRLEYPIAIDSDYRVWRAFRKRARGQSSGLPASMRGDLGYPR